ncbi:hypothetical protein AcW1_009017 [Taiwanofungus camphoratus]|nr:hypothetical protein AcW1_009017 [Antrodia cinnamomea]
MHAVSHSLSHRGPGATRARTRWQPYSSITLSSNAPPTSRTPTTAYLNTPASSVSASPPPTHLNPICDLERLKVPFLAQPSLAGLSRDVQKARYVTRLVDQAVKSLCDIWHPDDIPPVFRVSACSLSNTDVPQTQQECTVTSALLSRNTQLPSPISPSNQSLPSPPLTDSCGSFNPSITGTRNHHLPIKGFVHEVLRRSRTSTGVLQTALCYLEAIRAKVPELIRKENSKPSSETIEEGSEDTDRIVLGEVDPVADEWSCHDSTAGGDSAGRNILDTVRVVNACLEVPEISTSKAQLQCPQTPPDSGSSRLSSQYPSSLPPLPPLPSPLLCPRRTFLACLILASKFMQDRSYSNRAWAKLAGLPPREIGRCERAVGNALEWRLWVGKNVTTMATSSGSRKNMTRSRSDGDLLNVTATTPWSTPAATPSHPSNIGSSPVPFTGAVTHTQMFGTQGELRRSSTMPTLAIDTTILSTSRSAFYAPNVFAPLGFTEETNILNNSDVDISPPFSSVLVMDREVMQQDADVSPSMSTPTLSYSPMSSASSSSSDSSGERTVQMSMFTDLPISPASFACAPCPAVWDHFGITTHANAKRFEINATQNMDVLSPMDSTLLAFTPASVNYVPYSLPFPSGPFVPNT